MISMMEGKEVECVCDGKCVFFFSSGSHLVPGSTQPPLAPDRLGEAALSRGWVGLDGEKGKGGETGKGPSGPKQTGKPKQKQNKNKGFRQGPNRM